jgi:aminoglycoside 6'-N-acetyltransferase I
LISFVEQWAISSGFSELASDVALQNSHSIALHATLGFREVGRSVHFVKTLEAEIAKPVPSISDLSR